MGLEILNKRINTSEDLNALLISKVIPQIFRTFLNQYEVEYRMLNLEKVLIDGELEVIQKVEMFDGFKINDEDYHATIDMIHDYPQLLDELEKYKKREDHWHDEGLMKIGLMFHGDVLLLGVEESNKDEIWRYGTGVLNTVCSRLDLNIFDFFSRVTSLEDPDKLEEFGIDKTKLYKNWSEDFWRIRE